MSDRALSLVLRSYPYGENLLTRLPHHAVSFKSHLPPSLGGPSHRYRRPSLDFRRISRFDLVDTIVYFLS